MNRSYLHILLSLFVSLALLLPSTSNAQCPQFFEDNGTIGSLSTTPLYIGCTGGNYTLNVRSNVALGPYTIVWGDGSPNTTGTGLAAFTSVSHTYTYPPSDTFNITITANGCTAVGFVVVEEPVNASIQIPLGGVTQSCAPQIMSFVNSSTNVSITTEFTWDFGDGTPVQVFDHTNVGDTLQHLYNVGTVDCETQVTLTAENFCSFGNPTTAIFDPILIWDIDEAAIGASATLLCYPDTTFTFTNATDFNCDGPGEGNFVGRLEYWNLGNYFGTGMDSIIDWQPVPSAPITIAFPGPGFYTITMLDSNQCGVDPATITVEITEPPQIFIEASEDTICAGESITFTDSVVGAGNAYFWDFGDGGTSNAAGPVTHTFNTDGTYTVKAYISIAGANNCQDSAEITVHVLESPVAGINLNNQNGCDSLDVTFTDNSTGVGALVNWNWDFDNGNTSTAQNPPLQKYDSPGTYNVTLSVTNSLTCTDVATQVIDVYQTPIPVFTPTSVCVNELAQFLDSSLSAPGDPVTSWLWNFGDGSPTSTLQNPTHTYTAAGTYNVIFDISTANCAASDTTTVVAEQLPTASFTEDTTIGCSPLTVNFTNTSSANATRFEWDFGDGDTDTVANPSQIFLNFFGVDTAYDVRMIAYTNFGCTDTATSRVEVFPNPVALFQDSSLLINCTPAVIGFRNLSLNGAVSYDWDFGNGNTSTAVNPIDTFINDSTGVKTFSIRLIAFSNRGCSDTSIQSVLIFPKPSSLPTKIDSGCETLVSTMPLVSGAVNFNWNSGFFQTSTAPTPNFTYALPGNYTVTLIATSPVGCRDTSQGEIEVYPRPQSQFFEDQTTGCAPLDVNFIATSSAGDSLYHWDFGNGDTLLTTDTTANYIFQNLSDTSRTFTVTLTVENDFGCDTFSTRDIEVFANVEAGFTHDTIGCSPFPAEFNSTSSSSAVSYFWDWGDGTNPSSGNNPNPIHGYSNTGQVQDTHRVMMVAFTVNLCNDTAYSDVIVFPNPVANFAVTPPSGVKTYPDTTFIFNNLDLRWRAQWDWGDGTESFDSIPGSHAFPGWGEFLVLLRTYNEFCEDTMTERVTILPPLPIPDFGDPTQGCEDLEVKFSNKSKYADSYKWQFVHATTTARQTSTDPEPEIFFTDPGLYNVILTAFGDGNPNGETKTEFGYVEVYEQPLAQFTFAPEEVFIPNQATVFFNNSRGDDLSYTWDFGDGGSSSAENPEHYYTAEGSYNVTLIATNGFCSDTATSDSEVLAKPSGSVETPNAFTPRTDGDPGNNGAYDFSQPGFDNTANDVFYPKITGEIREYEFMIFNKWGELLFRTDIQTVGWTGWYRDRLCQQDVYVYQVRATMVDESEVVLTGDLTLLR